MHRASTPVRILALVSSVLLFFAAGGGALAVADDYVTRDVLPLGARVADVDVSMLTRAEARALVEREVAEPRTRPLEVTYEDRSFTLDASALVSVDVEGMVETAFDPKRTAPLPERVAYRALGRPAGGSADLALTVDDDGLSRWIASVADRVDRPTTDATMTVEAGQLVVVESERGVSVDRDATANALRAALVGGERHVVLPVTHTEPRVTTDDLGPGILVDISERTLYLYRGGELLKTYRVAVGTPSHPTPRGNYRITLKRYMPSWGNPGSAWAADMPAYIPPGPSNPLGTRALNLDAPGIRIHGTSNNASIGTAASHGCMRMHRWDIEDLYERVEVGTPVFIVR